MAGPIRVRLACDRCHAHKLRCPKQAGSPVCTRCARAGAACVFSPPGKAPSAPAPRTGAAPISTARASQPPTTLVGAAETETPPPVALLGDDVDYMDQFLDVAGLTWPMGYQEMEIDTGLGVVVPNADPAQGFRQNSPFNNAPNSATDQRAEAPSRSAAPVGSSSSSPTPDVDNDEPTAEMGPGQPSITRRLSGVLQDLDSVLRNLPAEGGLPHVRYGDAATFQQELQALTQQQQRDYRKTLEQLFRSSQALVELYPAAVAEALAGLDASTGRRGATACEIPGCAHELPTPRDLLGLEDLLRNDGGRLSAGGGGVDAALASLLMACHLRFLDVLDGLFSCAVACFTVAAASPGGRTEPDFDLPEVRIGSFVPPRGSRAMVQAFLLRHLLGGLGKGAGQLAAALGGGGEGGGDGDRPAAAVAGGEVRVLRLQCEVLREKHAAREDRCQDVAAALVRFEMMK